MRRNRTRNSMQRGTMSCATNDLRQPRPLSIRAIRGPIMQRALGLVLGSTWLLACGDERAAPDAAQRDAELIAVDAGHDALPSTIPLPSTWKHVTIADPAACIEFQMRGRPHAEGCPRSTM